MKSSKTEKRNETNDSVNRIKSFKKYHKSGYIDNYSHLCYYNDCNHSNLQVRGDVFVEFRTIKYR